MRMKLGGVAAIALASMLLSSGALAGGLDPTFRLNGNFSSTEEGAADGANEACITVDFNDFAVEGEVDGVSGGCTAFIFYDTVFPHKASATAIKSGKGTGTAKMSQSVFTLVQVGAFDTDGAGVGVCAEAFSGNVNGFQEDSEKCKASASMKGTANASPSPDSLQDANVSMGCELGENGALIDTSGASGVQPPTVDQFNVVVAAFEGRKDVKVDSKGKVSVKQNGVEEASTATPFCD